VYREHYIEGRRFGVLIRSKVGRGRGIGKGRRGNLSYLLKLEN